MTYAEQLAVERRARLVRLGARQASPVKITERAVVISLAPQIDVPPVEEFYPNMWFHHLVNMTPVEPLVADIQEACAAHFRVCLSTILLHGQISTSVLPRHVAMYLSRRLTSISVNRIAREFNRDHATVLYAIRKIGRAIKTDAKLAKTVEAIMARFI